MLLAPEATSRKSMPPTPHSHGRTQRPSSVLPVLSSFWKSRASVRLLINHNPLGQYQTMSTEHKTHEAMYKAIKLSEICQIHRRHLFLLSTRRELYCALNSFNLLWICDSFLPFPLKALLLMELSVSPRAKIWVSNRSCFCMRSTTSGNCFPKSEDSAWA